MEQSCVPLVKEFSELEPYQKAYTLVCSLEPEGKGFWLSVCRRASDDSESRARAWLPAPEEECRRLLRYLYENSVQPEVWRDTIACWYPQASTAGDEQEGGAARGL